MIVRQNLPMAARVNVVPMRRRKRGLGDTCTPTNCPSGPYTDPNSNYNYWTLQSQLQGNQPETRGEELNPSQISAGAGSAQPVCPDYASCMRQLGPPALAADNFNTGDVNAHTAAMNDFNTWYLTSPQSPHNLPSQGGGSAVPSSPITYAVWSNLTQGAAPASPASPTSSAVPTSIVSPGGPYPNASVTFSTPRASGPLYPGDAWTIRISGAAPNSQVAVTGNSSPATYGTNVTTPMGTTDSSGNWSLSGTMASSSVGQWYENWSVGGKSVGSFSFQVLATPAPVANGSQGPAPAPAGTTPSSGTATTLASAIPSWFTETSIDSIPNWLLALGAVGVGWFLLKGKM